MAKHYSAEEKLAAVAMAAMQGVTRLRDTTSLTSKRLSTYLRKTSNKGILNTCFAPVLLLMIALMSHFPFKTQGHG